MPCTLTTVCSNRTIGRITSLTRLSQIRRTIAITAVRLALLLSTNFHDFSYSSADIFVWTTVEWGIAFMVTCGPGMRPILEKMFPSMSFSHSSGSRKYLNNSRTIRGQKGIIAGNRHAFGRITDDEIALEPQSQTITRIEPGGVDESEEERVEELGFGQGVGRSQGLGPQSINVERQWSVRRE